MPTPTLALKSANTVRTSTTTLADDPDLTATLTAGACYEIECVLRWGNSATVTVPNFKWAWNFTGSLIWANGYQTMNNRPMDIGWRNTDNIDRELHYTAACITTAAPATAVTASTGVWAGAILRCWLKVGDTGGTFSLQWAQGTSSVNQTTVYAGSGLYVCERQFGS